MKIDDITPHPGGNTIIEELAYIRESDLDTETEYGFNDGNVSYRCSRAEVDAYVDEHGAESSRWRPSDFHWNHWYSKFCSAVDARVVS